MRCRRAFALCLLGLVVVHAAGAHACGDKWLVSSRAHGEHGGFTSLQPTEILIYSDERHGSVDLELLDETMADALRNAGHRVEFVNADELAAKAANPRYELVLFAYEDADAVEGALMALDRKPSLLPLLSDEDGDVTAAQDRFGWAVPCCSLSKLNQTIDELMITRVGGEA
jgi:hypothetical protein